MSRVSLTTVFCLTVLFVSGCQTSLRSFAKGTTGQLDPPNVAGRTPVSEPVLENAGPLIEPTREQAFAAVLGDLQEIGREDPAAQQRLVTQLYESDPAHWEGLVMRMRSTMQYHRQIAGEPATTSVMQASSQQSGRNTPSAHQATSSSPGTPSAASAPLPQRPGTWPAQPELPPADGQAEQGVDTRRFDPKLTQTNAVDVAHQGSAATPLSTRYADGAAAILDDSQQEQPLVDLRSETPAANPAATPQTWDESLQAAIDQLTGQLDERPQSIDEAYQHLRLRLLQLAAGNMDGAAASVPGLTATEQQYWSHQLLAVSTLLDNQSQPEVRRRAAAGGLHLRNALTSLEQLGSLTVGHLRFCEEVYGFGAYQPLEHARFLPGGEVKIYAEVANFKTVTTPQGEHTSLATSYQVLDQHGARVDGGDVPVVNDYCASRRRDFHIQYGITLPQGIYPGEYVLELTLTDQLGDKIGHGTIDFEIVASE